MTRLCGERGARRRTARLSVNREREAILGA